MRWVPRWLGALGLALALVTVARPAGATIYFACGEDLCLQAQGAATVTTNPSYYDSTYAREALSNPSSGAAWEAQDALNGATGLSSWEFHVSTQAFGNNYCSNGNEVIGFVDSTGVDRLYIAVDGSCNISVDTRNAAGTTAVLAGPSTNVTCQMPGGNGGAVTHFIVDVANYGASGTVTVYAWVNGSPTSLTTCLTYTGAIATDSATALTGFILKAASNGGASEYSEMIVADGATDLRQARLITLAPASVGNTDAWTCSGSTSYGSVNPTSITDTVGCSSPTSAQLEEFGVGALPSGNYTVLALGEYIRAEKSASGPQNIQADVRSGTTSTQSADLAGLQTVFGTVSTIWATNPTTAAAWTTSALSSVQIGFESQP